MNSDTGTCRWWIYNFLFTVGYSLMMPKFLLRMKKRGGYKAHFSQRFGKFEPDVSGRLAEKRRMWVHAVSVGEAKAAGKLLEELRRQSPGISFVLSTTSSTGYGICEKLVGPEDVLIYFPLDFPGMVRKALDAVKPSSVVITESELWPNFLIECSRRGIPVILANARISDRSFPKYKMIRYFIRPVLRTFRLIEAQFEHDRDRLIELGANAECVKITGTVKFDVSPPNPDALERVHTGLESVGIMAGKSKVLLGASTWPGEEAALLAAFKKLSGIYSELRLVIVPRHKERGDEVEREILSAGFRCVRRSRQLLSADLAATSTEDTVYLADTTGELFSFMTFSDIIFVGKSLPPNRGGQDMIEASSLGKPVIVGPCTENFRGPMDILRKAGGIAEIADTNGLFDEISKYLADTSACVAIGSAASAAVRSNAGALSRTAAGILKNCH